MREGCKQQAGQLADAALRQALVDTASEPVLPHTGGIVESIFDQFGLDGLVVALQVWCDRYMEHAMGCEDSRVDAVSLSFVDRMTLAPAGPEVDDSSRWAAELISARALRDRDRFMALVADVLNAADGSKLGMHMAAVLSLVSHGINMTPAGYAALSEQMRGEGQC